MRSNGIKYCIWGCGERGKHLFQFMKGQGVHVFIDSNPALQETIHQGVPIISYETYKKAYNDCIVIVAVAAPAEIIRELEQYHIPCFSALLLPPEMTETPYEDLFILAERRLHQEKTLYFYGLNLYSLLLAEHLISKGRNVKIVPGEKESAMRMVIEEYKGTELFCGLSEVGDAPLYMTSTGYYRDKLPRKDTIDLYDFTFDIKEYYKPSLEKYRNLHQGKRCFIIGTGPSLRMSDLDGLAESGDICIGLNGIVRAYSSTKWRPTYYMVNAPIALKEWGRELLGECRTEHMFMPDNIDYPHGGAFEIYHLSRLLADGDCPPKFTTDFAQGCYAYGVTYCALQFAAYLGCSTIYLYGIDFYYNRNYGYFTDNYSETFNKRDQYNTAFDRALAEDMRGYRLAYLSAKQTAEKRGFTIYNATRKTWLDVFERVDFDQLFHN